MTALSKDLRTFLKENYYWNGEEIVSPEKLKKLFQDANYNHPNDNLIDFLAHFYNYTFKLRYSDKEVDIDFRIKKVLKDFPYKYFYVQIKELLKVEEVTPFGEIDNGHMVLISDEENNIYAVMDDYVIKLGNNYEEMLESFYKHGY